MLVNLDFMDEAVWIPRSQSYVEPQDFQVNTSVNIFIKEWLCKKNGWEEYSE